MRGFLLTVVVGLVIFGVIAWSTGLFDPSQADARAEPKALAPKGNETEKKHGDIGPPLFKGQAIAEPQQTKGAAGKDPVIISGSHLAAIQKVDVSFLIASQGSQNEGKLIGVGREARKDDPPSKIRLATMYRGGKPIIFRYYEYKENDPIDYQAGNAEGSMVALMDTTLQDADVAIKRAKLDAARADWLGAVALADVYAQEVERLERIKAGGPKLVSDQDYQVAKAQREKYKEEANSKKKAIDVANEELVQGQTVKELFILRNPIHPPPGARTDMIRIKTIYKQPGEVIRNQEPVLQVQDLGRLQAECLVDVHFLDAIHRDQEVIVLPTHRKGPYSTFPGHRGEITALAVSSDKEPFIVSGSEDGTVRVWKLQDSQELRILHFTTAVRSLACSPVPGGKHSYLLIGLTDGSVQLWDLRDDKAEKPVWIREDQATDAINCVAFSPDGKMYVTGSADNSISLWNTEQGTKVYTFDADTGHQGAVTSLHFTPDWKLVSAGGDNTLRVWTLGQKGAGLDTTRDVFGSRGGSVSQLGVSHDGRYMLFDQGKYLKVKTLAKDRTVGEIQDLSGGTPFETLAAFSPDDSLILTTSSTDGRLQLWKTPTGTGTPRTFEVQQLVTKGSSRPTCAAFGKVQDPRISPTFLVTGTKDGLIYLWEVPGKDQIEKRVKGRISFVEPSVEPSTRQARVKVDVSNDDKKDPLIVGETITVVIPRE